MSCEAMEPLIALYIDDALTPRESGLVEEHLRDCPSCQSLLAELRANQAELKSFPRLNLPSHFREELLRKVATMGKNRKPVFRYLLPRLGSLAAALMVVLLTSNLYLFPALWPTPQPDAGDPSQMGIMAASPQVELFVAGDATGKSEDSMRSKAASIAPSEDATPNYWLWSGVAAFGLFGIGTGFFVYRYRHN